MVDSDNETAESDDTPTKERSKRGQKIWVGVGIVLTVVIGLLAVRQLWVYGERLKDDRIYIGFLELKTIRNFYAKCLLLQDAVKKLPDTRDA